MRTDTLASVLVCLLFSAVVLADCNVGLFTNDRHITNDDILCFNQVDYPQYQTQKNGYPCTTNCKTLDGVESAARCHDIVKNAGCGASFFAWKPHASGGRSRCWAKSGFNTSKRRDGAVSGAIQASNCVTEAEIDVCKAMMDSPSIKEWIQCNEFGNDNPNSCKAYLKTRDTSLFNCDAFCASLGYVCYEAYKEAHEDSNCGVRSGQEMSCSGPDSNDYVCGCEAPPAYWKNCRWEETKDQDLHDTAGYMGWTCANNEILTGFELQATEDDVTKVQCCELGGHSSVVPDTCAFIDVTHPEIAYCNADDHMVFSGAYDRSTGGGDGYTEIQVGRCCEVNCDAPWCAGNDWGVNTEQCLIIRKDPDNNGVQELVCPDGYLLTEIHDGHEGAHEIQIVEKVKCCALDLIAKPTKAPTTSPTPSPTRSPSPPPTDAPSPSPTEAPSSSPTTAPTSCFLPLRSAPDMTDAEWLTAIERCCADSIPHRRALMGRLLTEDAALPTLERPSLIKQSPIQ